MTEKERRLFERMYFLLQRVYAELRNVETRNLDSELSLLMTQKKIDSAIVAVSEYYGSGE
jgi:hypothetical protein